MIPITSRYSVEVMPKEYPLFVRSIVTSASRASKIRERFLRDASRKLCRARGIREIRDFRSVPLRTGPSSGEMTLRRKLLWKTATFNYEYKGSLDVARYSLLPVHLFVLHEPVWDGSPLFLQIGAFARINENGSTVHWNPIGKPTWTA